MEPCMNKVDEKKEQIPSENILCNVSSEKLDSHSEFLLGLFIKSDETELKGLADHADSSLSCLAREDETHSRASDYSQLALLSDAVSSFDIKSENYVIAVPSRYRRPGAISLSLDQLESQAYSRYMSEVHPNTITQNVQKSNQKDSSNVESFSLMFNECSLAALSCWAATNSKKGTGKFRREVQTCGSIKLRLYRVPVPSANGRYCHICGRWGHYDVECDQMKEADLPLFASTRKYLGDFDKQGLKLLSNATDDFLGRATKTVEPLSSKNNNSDFIARNSGYESDVSSTIEIEGFEGFVIEQSKLPNANKKRKLNKSSWSTKLVVADAESNFVRETLSDPNEDDTSFTYSRILPQCGPYETCVLSSLSIWGCKRVYASEENSTFGSTHFSGKEDIIGVRNRSGDGCIPLYCSPAITCTSCKGHFPTHMLTSIFKPCIEFYSNTGYHIPIDSGSFLPPLPWESFPSVKYTCGYCDNTKEGTVTLDDKFQMNWRERCQNALLNLIILANPTAVSKMSAPSRLTEKRYLPPNLGLKFHLHFDVDDICDFIVERSPYYAISKPKPEQVPELKEQIRNTLQLMEKDGLVKVTNDSKVLDYYSLTFEGFPLHTGEIEAIPQHVHTVLNIPLAKTSIRASTIARSHPECIVTKANKIFHTNESHASNNLESNLGDLEEEDVSEEDGILIYSKRDDKEPKEKSKDRSISVERITDTVGEKNGKDDGMGGDNQAQSDEEKLNFIEMPSSPCLLKGTIVAWNSQVIGNEQTSINLDPNFLENVCFGSVADVSPYNTALVRVLSQESIISLITSEHYDSEGHFLIYPCDLGTSVWLPIGSLKIISHPPSLEFIDLAKEELRSYKPQEETAIDRENRIKPTDQQRTEINQKHIPKKRQNIRSENTSQAAKRKRNLDHSPINEVGKRPTSSSSASKNSANSITKKKPSRAESPIPSIVSQYILRGEKDINPNKRQKNCVPGIFAAEKILGDRVSKIGSTLIKSYLIKWKGFDPSENTWEPDKGVIDRNLVKTYKAEKYVDQLNQTEEAKKDDSATWKMIKHLEVFLKKLANGKISEEDGAPVRRPCHFCGRKFIDACSLGGHMRCHNDQINYRLIMDAGRYLSDEGFSWT